jgi:hypothetical protein
MRRHAMSPSGTSRHSLPRGNPVAFRLKRTSGWIYKCTRMLGLDTEWGD